MKKKVIIVLFIALFGGIFVGLALSYPYKGTLEKAKPKFVKKSELETTPKSEPASDETQGEIISRENNVLCFKGEYAGSCLTAIDINNDGRKELIYAPRGHSFHLGTLVLQEAVDDSTRYFKKFCQHCHFSTYASNPIFEDINSDSIVEAILPIVVDDDWNFELQIYYFENDDFVLKKRHPLPKVDPGQSEEVEKLLEKYMGKKRKNY